MSALHIFLPDAASVPCNTSGLVAASSSPKQSFELSETGWRTVDLVRSFPDDAQRAAIADGIALAGEIERVCLLHSLDPALSHLLQVQALRLVSAWRRFEGMTEGFSTLRIAGKTGFVDCDRQQAFYQFIGLAPIEMYRSDQASAIRANVLSARSLIPGLRYLMDQRSESGRFHINAPYQPIRVRHPKQGDRLSLFAGIQGIAARRLIAPLYTEHSGADPLRSLMGFANLPQRIFESLHRAACRYMSAKYFAHAFLQSAGNAPIAGLYNELSTPELSGIACALKSSGRNVGLISHGSFCVHGSGEGRQATAILARGGLNWSANATLFFPRSPVIANSIPEHAQSKIVAARFNSQVPTKSRGKASFTILHAGNYVRWGNVSYIAPNESEYLQSLAEFTRAVDENRNLRSFVRIKEGIQRGSKTESKLSKTGVGSLLFERTQGWSERVQPSLENKFSSALVGADLLVSEGFTATIQEALEYGLPVLLHTTTNRFPHMDSRTTPPTRSDRAVVYACDSEKLPVMLEAIRLAHENAPLTDAELSAYRWPRDRPAINDALAAVL